MSDSEDDVEEFLLREQWNKTSNKSISPKAKLLRKRSKSMHSTSAVEIIQEKDMNCEQSGGTGSHEENYSSDEKNEKEELLKPVSDEYSDWIPEKIQKEELIHYGSYGETYRVVHKDTRKLATLKISKNTLPFKSKYLSEEYIWKKASCHSYIAQLYHAYSDGDRRCYVSEYLPGSNMRTFIKIHKVLQTRVAELVTVQIVTAIHFLHHKGIFHHDVSNRNIMIGTGGIVKLTNFRHSVMNKTARGIHGNFFYQAPEVFSGKIYDITADWFSLGVCLYEMVMGMTPIEYHCMCHGIHFLKLDFMGRIVVLQTSKIYIPEMFPENLKRVLEHLLHKDYKQRLGYKDNLEHFKQHPFFCHVDWKKLECGMLTTDLPEDDDDVLLTYRTK